MPTRGNGHQDAAPPCVVCLLALLTLLLPAIDATGAVPVYRHAIESAVELGNGRDYVELSLNAPGGADRKPVRVEIEARVALNEVREKSGLNPSWWGVSLIPETGDTVNVSLRFGNAAYGDFTDRKMTRVTITRGDKTLFEDNDVKGFVAMSRAYNSLSFTLSDGKLTVSGGGHTARTIVEVPLADSFTTDNVRVWSHGCATVSQFIVETVANRQVASSSGVGSIDELNRRLSASVDPVEGYWRYFDRQNDPSYAHPGGRYTVATVRIDPNDATAGYDILYIDGAETFADEWRPLMVKGHLRPTVFEGHYDMEWIDSSFNRIEDDIHAKIENDNALLTLSFPMLRTVMRFSKMPK